MQRLLRVIPNLLASSRPSNGRLPALRIEQQTLMWYLWLLSCKMRIRGVEVVQFGKVLSR